MPGKPMNDHDRLAHELIKPHPRTFPVEVVGRELGVAPSAHRQLLNCPQPERDVENGRRRRMTLFGALVLRDWPSGGSPATWQDALDGYPTRPDDRPTLSVALPA